MRTRKHRITVTSQRPDIAQGSAVRLQEEVPLLNKGTAVGRAAEACTVNKSHWRDTHLHVILQDSLQFMRDPSCEGSGFLATVFFIFLQFSPLLKVTGRWHRMSNITR